MDAKGFAFMDGLTLPFIYFNYSLRSNVGFPENP